MGLDDLKKSWNALDEHLKGKEFIKGEEMKQLLGHIRNNINSIGRLNRKLRFVAIGIPILAAIFWMCNDALTNFHYQIAFLLCIPALCWDLYPAHYLEWTRVDEMSLVTVVFHISRYHRWMAREWIIGMLCLLMMATLFSFHKQVRQYDATGIISSLAVQAVGLGVCPWVYRRNLRHIKEIKKNLNELEELNYTA